MQHVLLLLLPLSRRLWQLFWPLFKALLPRLATRSPLLLPTLFSLLLFTYLLLQVVALLKPLFLLQSLLTTERQKLSVEVVQEGSTEGQHRKWTGRRKKKNPVDVECHL